MEKQKAYWKAHLRLLGILLIVWFIIGIGLPVLLVDQLNNFQVAGFPLGFWIAFQGVFILFPLLALVYARLMRRLDKKYLMEED